MIAAVAPRPIPLRVTMLMTLKAGLQRLAEECGEPVPNNGEALGRAGVMLDEYDAGRVR